MRQHIVAAQRHTFFAGSGGGECEIGRGVVEKAGEDSAAPEIFPRVVHGLANDYVYTQEVLDALRKMEAAGAVEEISLSEEYLKAGGHIAERRVVQAGFRLAELLKSLMD